MTTYAHDLEQIPPLDGTKPFLAVVVGRKGTGKSTIARELWTDYPYDKVLVDPTGDGDPGPEAVQLRAPFPERMPAPQDDGRPHVLHARVEPRDPAYRDQMDQAVGLALYPQTRPALVWCDEWALVAGPNDVRPHARQLITASRHHQTSAILCCPRPLAIATNTVAQADVIYMLPVPNRQDQEMLANRIGTSYPQFRRAMNNLGRRPPFWYLRWDADNGLIMCPPFPEPVDAPNAKPS